ncbi:antitoxin Xre/MbcA/ParS toxin-binding domain-containing protein [Pseudomonas sp. URMO17WK12:I11]|uniref:antitoxin Xre/MbcA/ParS toxin-binding domain-containing protein n=1 Tax=Pseudomonas sp. URMO17WK12:I11 TaxID=1283291 RepID=UPI0015B4159B|nr:antitoxin Xre/MbcA/ParS toxin-binding domain-containing protein [Pseudomonas sp. URMO17WK12:I11]
MNDKEIDKEVLEAAIKLFGGDYVEAIIWLNRPQLALGNVRPVDASREDVLRLISQIEHGVYN